MPLSARVLMARSASVLVPKNAISTSSIQLTPSRIIVSFVDLAWPAHRLADSVFRLVRSRSLP